MCDKGPDLLWIQQLKILWSIARKGDGTEETQVPMQLAIVQAAAEEVPA